MIYVPWPHHILRLVPSSWRLAWPRGGYWIMHGIPHTYYCNIVEKRWARSNNIHRSTKPHTQKQQLRRPRTRTSSALVTANATISSNHIYIPLSFSLYLSLSLSHSLGGALTFRQRILHLHTHLILNWSSRIRSSERMNWFTDDVCWFSVHWAYPNIFGKTEVHIYTEPYCMFELLANRWTMTEIIVARRWSVLCVIFGGGWVLWFLWRIC